MYPITSTRRLSTIKEEKDSKESLLATSYRQPLDETFKIIEFNETSTPMPKKRASLDNVIDIDDKSDNENDLNKSVDFSRTLIGSILSNNTSIKRLIGNEIHENDVTICANPSVYDEPKDFLRVCLKCNVDFKASKYHVSVFNKHLNECSSFTCKYCHQICLNNNTLVNHLKEKHGK